MVGLVLTLLAAPAPAVAGPDDTGPPSRQAGGDPRTWRGLFVDPLMPAAQASLRDSRFTPLGSRAQALWITDYYPVDQVKEAVRAYAERANRADKTGMIALYAIPGRDCGLHSAGGFDPATYRRWVRQVAKGARGQHLIAVIEPDAVPFLGDCGGQGPRAALLREATRKLARAGAWVYLDAGHDGWHSPEVMVERLLRSGIRHARGFSTNVGNYMPDGVEKRYGRAIVRGLAQRGVLGKRFVVETARNGAGPAPDLEVCNPPSARIGRPPRLHLRRPFDGYVWVKHPGESDGPCYGGPSSGEWWPEGADRLLGLAGAERPED